MNTFHLVDIDARIVDGKLAGEATGGCLAEVLQPYVSKLIAELNARKVIARKEIDGHEAFVYSLYDPPHPSRPGFRHFDRKIKELIFRMPFPDTASIAVTYRCPCNCRNCRVSRFVRPDQEELSAGELMRAVDDALQLGVSLIVYGGGEPLLREDLASLIRHVDQHQAVVILQTSGIGLITEKVKEIADAGLAYVYISIDHVDPEVHNRGRQAANAHEAALEGAARCREEGLLVGLSTYATPKALRDGSVRRLVDLAESAGINEVTIHDRIPSGRFLRQADRILTRADREIVLELDREYNGPDHRLGLRTQSRVSSPYGLGCVGAFSQFHLTAYGDALLCDCNPISFGNVRESSVQTLWHAMASHPDFRERHLACRMQTPAYRRRFIDWIPDEESLPIPVERARERGRE